jgi:uncharacterized protein YjiS (DUF1127 family)
MIAAAQSRRFAHAPLVDALDLVLTWVERGRQRAALASLEPHALHDLGLSRADIDCEIRKRFWER